MSINEENLYLENDGLSEESLFEFAESLSGSFEALGRLNKEEDDYREKSNQIKGSIVREAYQIVDACGGIINSEDEKLKELGTSLFNTCQMIIRFSGDLSHHDRLVRQYTNNQEYSKLSTESTALRITASQLNFSMNKLGELVVKIMEKKINQK